MRNIIIFIGLLFSFLSTKAQQKYDNVWILGNGINPMTINWEKHKPDTATFPKDVYVGINDPNASICTADGKFMYFSNGCTILGRNLAYIANGKNINPGWVHDNYCGASERNPYPAFNCGVFLPKPDDSTRYVLFHSARSGSSDSNSIAFPFVWFYYSEIDSKQFTYGKVIKKNIQLGPRDSMSEIGPIACKHSNGKDWWVIIPAIHSHAFYRAILTSQGASYIGKQILKEEGARYYRDWAGQGVFTPDGNKYIRTDPHNGTFIYNFDRCTGLLSKPVFIDTLVGASCSGAGVSPNSRFLYISNRDILHQFDLEANDILASKIEIAKRDSFITNDGYAVAFYKCLLAPDGKIYVGSTGSVDWLSTIHYPNEKGIACGFQQHDLKLPHNYYVGLPNLPHFRMPAKDVICAPIIANQEHWEEQRFNVFPNPSRGNITIQNYEITDNIYTWQLFDTQGKQVFSHSLQSEKTSLDLPIFLPQGIYFWCVNDGVKLVQSGKLVLVE